MAHFQQATETLGYAVHVSLFNAADGSGTYLTIGVGGWKRMQQARLTSEQTRELTRQFQSIQTMHRHEEE